MRFNQKTLQPELLIVIHELGWSASRKDVLDRLIVKLDLTDDEIWEVYGTGVNVFKNMSSWAREYLKQAGYLANSMRGVWELSEKGKAIIPDLLEWKNLLETSNLEVEAVSPWADISDSLDSESHELTYIKSIDPYKFERLCAKLFEKMNLENVKYTQSSKDNGIDGYGDLVFGLVKFRIVFQAKRFKNQSVGAPDIQKLLWAQHQHWAEKSVFITTSLFTKEAKKSADMLNIELIDGEKLLALLKEKKLWFQEVLNYELDTTFFENL